jgi:hypothetical protein
MFYYVTHRRYIIITKLLGFFCFRVIGSPLLAKTLTNGLLLVLLLLLLLFFR